MRFRPAGRNPWTFPWQKKRNAKIDEAAMKLASAGHRPEPEDDDLSGYYYTSLKEAEIKKLADVLSNEGDGGIWEALDKKNSLIVAEALYRNGVRAR